MSTASALSGETYTTCGPMPIAAPLSCARYRRSMHTRNAASVLPEPVGAAMSVLLLAAISRQPRAWGSVGPSGKRRPNHVRTAGWNVSSIKSPYRLTATIWDWWGPASDIGSEPRAGRGRGLHRLNRRGGPEFWNLWTPP